MKLFLAYLGAMLATTLFAAGVLILENRDDLGERGGAVRDAGALKQCPAGSRLPGP